MTEPTPTNPSPTAIPWTPDMMNSQSHLAVQPPVQPPQQPQHYQAQHQQPAQMQNQPQYAPPHPQPIPQAYAPPPQHMAAPQMSQHAIPQSQPAQFAPQAQMAPPPSPQLHPIQTQPTPPDYGQTQLGQAPLNPSHAVPQRPQAGPPPLAPHMRVPPPSQKADPASGAGAESKSLFAKLLKRSPKPAEAQSDMAATNSGSLFNKNFALGALTGLVIGAFVLPMALDMFGGDTPVQTQAQAGPPAVIETTPTMKQGDAFIDEAIAADAP